MGEFAINTQSKNDNSTVLDKRLFVILLVVFVQILGASMVLPILPLYAKNQFGMSENTVTLLITAFFAAQFIAGPIIGRLSDNYGRIPVLVVSQIGTVISFIGLGIAGQVWLLFAARILDGITGGNIIVAQAYVTDIVPKEKRTQALGYIFLAFGVGFIFGPAMGGILASTFSYQTPYFVAAIAASVVVILTATVLEETVTKEQQKVNQQKKGQELTIRNVLTNAPLMAILAIVFGSQFAFAMLQSTYSLFGEAVIFSNRTEDVELYIGLLFGMFGVGQIFTQLYLLKRLTKSYGESPLVIIGTALRSISMYAIIIFITPISASIGVILFALGSGIQIPALQSLITNTVPDNRRGNVLGLFQSSMSLAIIFGSGLAGTLFLIAPQMPYIVGGTLYAVLLIPAYFLMRWAKRHENDEPQQEMTPVAASGD